MEVAVLRFIITFLALFAAPCAGAQMSMNMCGSVDSFKENVLRHTGSGTDLEPASGAPPMLMQMRPSGWMLMLHGEAIVTEQQQTGPRGSDKFFSVNWLMPMAQRNFKPAGGSFGAGQLTLRTMLSLEPATITGRFYPELFQQGETAFGKPIVDGQHPHNLFMEIAGLYDMKIGSRALGTLYAAPVGDPALGPPAYPHRPSTGDDPLAPLGHHLEDSTHIADDVVTAGLSLGQKQLGLRLEASGFHGREPDENRWHIEVGTVDSWSARLSIAPAKDIAAQYSLARLHSPESVHPEEDVLRQTASVSYHRSFDRSELNSIAVWGRNHTIGSAENANAYLFESALRSSRQVAWTRIENADRTTDLLGASAPPTESGVGRVQAYSGGYAHRIWRCNRGTVELGAQLTAYGVPPRLAPLYGQHPFGAAAILKFQLGSGGR
jgi:hypothetical protein